MRHFENHNQEAKEKWGNTPAYKEYTENTKGYSKENWSNLTAGMNEIFEKFAEARRDGKAPNSVEVQCLVHALQEHITENYYTCTKEILAGLGQMYVADQRFKSYIDQHADGTAEFTAAAILFYCKE